MGKTMRDTERFGTAGMCVCVCACACECTYLAGYQPSVSQSDISPSVCLVVCLLCLPCPLCISRYTRFRYISTNKPTPTLTQPRCKKPRRPRARPTSLSVAGVSGRACRLTGTSTTSSRWKRKAGRRRDKAQTRSIASFPSGWKHSLTWANWREP